MLCLYVCTYAMCALGGLELQSLMVMIHHMGAGNHRLTHALNQSHLSRPNLPLFFSLTQKYFVVTVF